MNEKEAKKLGKKHGKQMSSWVDVPQVGDIINRDIDWVGYGKYVTEDNMWDYFELLCRNACDAIYGEDLDEEEFDSLDSNEEIWQAYQDGLTDGIFSYIAEAQKNY